MKIALLIPVCSRNQSYEHLLETPLFRIFLPHFDRTKEEDKYTYKLFIGFDDDDVFYSRHLGQLQASPKVDVTVLTGCQHHPVRAWNTLFAKALKEDFDYFFQIGDDVGLQTEGWTSRFISYLQSNNNIGTVGPCEPMNYFGRKSAGKAIVNETNFVHRTHYDIFGYFFYPEIRNWYCDDWITFVYGQKYAHMDVHTLCSNEIKGTRYDITQCPRIHMYVEEGQTLLKNYLATHAPKKDDDLMKEI